MNHTAKDLFGDWYSQAVKVDRSAPEITLRQAAVSQILLTKERDFWLGLVRVFYNTISEENLAYQQVVAECQQNDVNFPIRNNSQVVRTIAGCALAQRIEGKRDNLRDGICLALLTTNFLERCGEYPIDELPQRAFVQWGEECRLMHAISSKLKSESTPVELKKPDFTTAQITNTTYGAETSLVNAAFTKVNEHLDSLQANIQAVANDKSLDPTFLTDLNSRFDILAEETNVLWWLFSGYSREIDQPFDEVGMPMMAVVGPTELADLTVLLPGMGPVKAHLTKAFRQVNNDAHRTEHSIHQIVESVPAQSAWLDRLLRTVPESYRDLLPCLYGLFCREEYGDSWANIYQKKAQIDPQQRVSPLDFGEHLYWECLFVRVFEQLS